SIKPELEGLIVPSKVYGIAAAGRPIVAITAADGEIARLVRRYRCGIVVEPGDGAGLAERLRGLYADSQQLEEMGRHARRMIDTEFTRRHAFERWRSVLADIA